MDTALLLIAISFVSTKTDPQAVHRDIMFCVTCKLSFDSSLQKIYTKQNFSVTSDEHERK
jgi:hypothetical protein